MTKPRHDQAPQDQHNRYQSEDDTPTEALPVIQHSPAQIPNPGGYTETPLRHAVKKHSTEFPEYPPVDFDPELAPAREIVPGVDKKPSWMKRGIAAVVAAGALGAGAYGIGYLKTKGEVDAITDAMGSDRSTSAEAFPNTQTSGVEGVEQPLPGDINGDFAFSKDEIQAINPVTDPETLKNIDPKFLLDAYANDFDAWRQSTYSIMQKYMTPAQAEVLRMPSTDDKSAYTDQDVLNAVAIDIADTSVQEVPEEGMRMLPLVMDKNCSGFDGIFNKADDSNMIISVQKQVDEQLPRPTGEFMGHDLSNVAQARVIKWENARSPHDTYTYTRYALYVLHEDNDKSAWQLVEKWEPAGANIMKALDALEE